LPTEATQVVFRFSRAARSFGICFAKATPVNCILIRRAAQFVGSCQQKQLKSTALCSPRSENSWDSPTKATQNDCILLARSEKFTICQQKQLKLPTSNCHR
jgi:hypothetical protein